MKFSNFIIDLKKQVYKNPDYLIAIFGCFAFLVAYLLLSLVKHVNFGTGYDLAIANQIVWQYSRFTYPEISVHAYAYIPALHDHVEIIYALLAPFYWLYSDAKTLIILQTFMVVSSGFAIYLLAKRHKINVYLSLALLFSYLTFFGVQNAIWSDVHSLVFGVSFLAFFIYFLDSKRNLLTLIFFLLALSCKEDMALLTLFISFVYFIKTRSRINMFIMSASILYLLFIFYIYFPFFTEGYKYASDKGLLSNINLANFANTAEKRSVFLYSFMSFGFLPLLNPLLLIPYFADIGHYFVLGSFRVTSAQGLYLHYRITSSLLLVWASIFAIDKFKRLNSKYFALYIVFFAAITVYLLHSPLTYLTKEWFWDKPSGINDIHKAIDYLPANAYVATQTNISPHISDRNNLVTVWGDNRDFDLIKSPCGNKNCKWLKWAGKPEYLLVDVSPQWDIRHLLANRPDFLEALSNMEKKKAIILEKEFGSAKIYKIIY